MKNLSGGSFELLQRGCSGQEVNAGRGRDDIEFYKSYNIIQNFVRELSKEKDGRDSRERMKLLRDVQQVTGDWVGNGPIAVQHWCP